MTDIEGKRTFEDVSATLAGIFDGIIGNTHAEGERGLEAISGEPVVAEVESALKSYDYEKFEYLFLHPRRQVTAALVARALGRNHKLEFLLVNQGFVSAHFERLFETYEGPSCCADKERTVMQALMKSLHNGTRIEFDYDGEYTYHLPKTILKDHDGIMAYFDSLQRLFYGRPESYINEISVIISQVTKAKDGGKN